MTINICSLVPNHPSAFCVCVCVCVILPIYTGWNTDVCIFMYRCPHVYTTTSVYYKQSHRMIVSRKCITESRAVGWNASWRGTCREGSASGCGAEEVVHRSPDLGRDVAGVRPLIRYLPDQLGLHRGGQSILPSCRFASFRRCLPFIFIPSLVAFLFFIASCLFLLWDGAGERHGDTNARDTRTFWFVFSMIFRCWLVPSAGFTRPLEA